MTDDRSGSLADRVKRRAGAWAAGLVAVAALAGAAMLVYGHGSGVDAFYERWGVDPAHLPYDPHANARADIAAGKARAAASGKLLMVTFGANWCPDCLTLHKDLEDPVTRDYARHTFEMVNVDVGEPGKNADLARELGLDLNGIPLAVFFGPDGRPFSDTSGGELEPARHYSSHDILGFLREVAVHRRVVSPELPL
ncbi:MAG TPA: thioredoxin family protein [Gammaproteobacteria bacterium]|nr:thioredoxin family protein [Gammaproteobacteria bacterium]